MKPKKGKKRRSDDSANIQNKNTKASTRHASECDANGSDNNLSAIKSSDVNKTQNNKKRKTDPTNEPFC